MKKLLALLLCAAMLVSLLGCQSSEAEPETAQVPETTAAPAAAEAPALETEPATEPTEPVKPWVNNVLADTSYAAPDYSWNVMAVPGLDDIIREKSGITSITFLDTLANMPTDAWDASQAQNGSVMAWLDGTDLYIAGEGGVMAPVDCGYLFSAYTDVVSFNSNGNFHTEQVESMSRMFEGMEKLEALDLTDIDTSKVTDMAWMFNGCTALKELNISNFDTTNLVDMSGMFSNCKSLTSLDVSGLNTENVLYMNATFGGLKGLTSLDVSSLDTSNVVDMGGMFSELTMEVLDLSSLDTSSAEDMHGMFVGCREMKSLNVSNFDTSNVVDMHMLFRDCRSLTSLDLSGWNTSFVEDMSEVFNGCDALTDLDLGEWEVDSAEEYQQFMNNNVKIDGQHWKKMFADVDARGSKLPKVNASNVITEPGIPEEGYDLTVYRNVPLNTQARKAAKTIPNMESILVDDIPIILITEETSDSMPIYIDLHAGGGSKEDRLGTLRDVAQTTGAYAVSIDAGAYGESQRGMMTDAESILMLVSDIEKVIAFCSTLPGADLGRIMIHGNSMGSAGAMGYLARGSFKPLYVSVLSTGADYTVVDSNSPVFGNHGEKKRDIPPLNKGKIMELMAEYTPIKYAENMMDTFLCLCAGSQDSDGSVDALEEKFKEMGKENYSFNWFDCGHDLPGEAYDIATNLMLETLATASPIDNSIPKVTVTVVAEGT